MSPIVAPQNAVLKHAKSKIKTCAILMLRLFFCFQGGVLGRPGNQAGGTRQPGRDEQTDDNTGRTCVAQSTRLQLH